jgi:SWI/SNF-related matrix-associated actin-dependent regulator of chromatin subfamily D
VEDQPWQADSLDVDAFDFSTNMDSSYRVKIEGRLLDEDEDDLDSDDSDDESEAADGDAMDQDGKEKKKRKPPAKQYRFSHFFKAMTVDFERSKTKDGAEQSVEWKKPVVAANAANLPNAADFDQLEFKRGGDENINITINLVRDENPERFLLSPQLADILDTNEATRAEATMGVWDYIKAMGLQEDDEKRSFDCDDRLRAVSSFSMSCENGCLISIGPATRQRIYTIRSRGPHQPHEPTSASQAPVHHPRRQRVSREPSAYHL